MNEFKVLSEKDRIVGYVLKKRAPLAYYFQLADFAHKILGESDFEAFMMAFNALGCESQYQECPEDKEFAQRMLDAIEAVYGNTGIYPSCDCRCIGHVQSVSGSDNM